MGDALPLPLEILNILRISSHKMCRDYQEVQITFWGDENLVFPLLCCVQFCANFTARFMLPYILVTCPCLPNDVMCPPFSIDKTGLCWQNSASPTEPLCLADARHIPPKYSSVCVHIDLFLDFLFDSALCLPICVVLASLMSVWHKLQLSERREPQMRKCHPKIQL